MGCRCTSVTLWRVVQESDDVELARAVWDAMDVQERTRFRSSSPPYGDHGPDIDMLKFVALELGAIDRLHQTIIAYTCQPKRFTVETARFLIEHRIRDPSWVFRWGVVLSHLDVVEMVARESTCAELWSCVEHFPRTKDPVKLRMLRSTLNAIDEKTHLCHFQK